MSYSKNHVDVLVEIRGWHKFRLTGIYGEPNRARREETWDLLRSLNTMEDIPWVLIGDMNNVLKQADKKGGNPYPHRMLDGFQSVLDDYNLHDVNLEGYQFTWERGHGTSNWIEVRLDRALVSGNFIQQFNEKKLTNLEHLDITQDIRSSFGICSRICIRIVEIATGPYHQRIAGRLAISISPTAHLEVDD
ncbi:hypothetical protein POM88_002149 [Heracleum sosnowskyi]|uniref:Endonuclease/exonuclease/phosphatase domain-containing protein n=1 Tax=Heracleum sosnowskyi TaxID=360622 RepID=A0AAD8NAB1_9APIA|nr:hypothetical protein POM88_002149 [Heracleum sosnowskyi]